MQAYSNPDREHDTYALPDIEIFYLTAEDGKDFPVDDDGDPMLPGWYWWTCFPGCMPDSSPFGPFETEDEALSDARDNYDEFGPFAGEGK
jgi:hypothetical protein